MQIINISVVKTKDNYHFLEWDARPDPTKTEIVDDYFFNLYYSRDPVSDYQIITNDAGMPIGIDGSTGPFAYIDRVKQFDQTQEYYYKIKMINKHDAADFVLSDSVTADQDTDGIHETIKFAEQRLYDMYQGEPVLILKKKVTGAHCPTCWSVPRQQRILTDCPTCFGSGYQDGYYAPIQIQMSFDATPKKDDLEETGEDLTNYVRARISNYPLVRPKDIVVNKDNFIRYIIIKNDITKLPLVGKSRTILSQQNYIISQILTLKEINIADPQYNIPLDIIEDTDVCREDFILDGGTAETEDFIWYINGNYMCDDEEV